MAGQHAAVPVRSGSRYLTGRWSRRTGSLLVIGAIPLSAGLIQATPALAQADDSAAPADRNAVGATRPVPVEGLAPVDPGALHLPDAAPPVAPIQAPDGTIRIGSTVLPRPDFVDPQLAGQVNDSAAQTEADLAQGLDSTGLEPTRSDRIAADTLGAAATGAAVGAGVTSPVAATGALVGAVTGVVAGLPFAPAGLVVIPPVGAAIGAGAITVPSAAAGAAVGAGIGAVEGALAPSVTPAQQPGPDGRPAPAEQPGPVDGPAIAS